MGQVHGGLLLVACQHPDVNAGSTDVVDRLLNLVLDTELIFLDPQIADITIMGLTFGGRRRCEGE